MSHKEIEKIENHESDFGRPILIIGSPTTYRRQENRPDFDLHGANNFLVFLFYYFL